MKKIAFSVLTIGLFALSLASCSKSDTPTDTKAVVKDSLKMTFKGTHYTLYSLKDGKEIPLADSATTKWDIGIKFYNIIVNSNASGPGKAGVKVMTDGNYLNFKDAAAITNFSYDTTTTKLAIDYNYKSPNSWYNYIPVNHGFSPKAGLYFVLKTAEGKYAKMEITDVSYEGYEQGAMYPNFLVYKFRYVYQHDGTTHLAH